MARSAGRQQKARLGDATGDRALEDILKRIREKRNFDFHNYKRGTLLRRVQRRMQDRGTRSVSEYARLLDRDPNEFEALVSAMLIKVTSFFRDPEIWEELSTKAIPQVLSEKRSSEEIRVWCAGCATGEEALGQVFWTLEISGLNRASLAKVRKSLSQNVATRLEQVTYELPGGIPGKALLSCVPIVDGGAPLGAVITFEDVTRLSNALAENAKLKEDNGRASKEA
jgi:CheR methyltransferase, all-alpha domain/CheR methyltransferase, SAM binding domain